MNDTESVNTFQSWTSNLTTCDSLEKALSSFHGNSKFQRKVLEIVTSLKNTINKKGGNETSTEFYAALLGFLSATEVDVETMEACLFVLKHLIRQSISAAVLRRTTSQLSRVLLGTLSGDCSKNEAAVKSVVSCLGKLVSVQTSDSWGLDSTTHLYRALFSLTTDARAAINKEARKSILSVFYEAQKSTGQPVTKKHPLNRESMAIVKSCLHPDRVNESDRFSFCLSTVSALLQSRLLATDGAVCYLEALLECLLSQTIAPIQCQILEILSELFVNRSLTLEQTARCLTSLSGPYLTAICTTSGVGRGAPSNKFIGQSWLEAMMMGFESVLLSEQTTFIESTSGQTVECRMVALTHGTNVLRLCCDWLGSGAADDREMGAAVRSTIGRLCRGKLVTSESGTDYLSPDEYNDADSWLTRWAEIVCRLLVDLSNWILSTFALENVAALLERSGGRDKCERLSEFVMQLVPRLAEHRDSLELDEEENEEGNRNGRKESGGVSRDTRATIEAVLGVLLRQGGVERLLELLPLTDVVAAVAQPHGDAEGRARTWIVPLIEAHTENTVFDRFRTLILPSIESITRLMDRLEQCHSSSVNNDGNQMEIDNDNKTSASTAALVSLGALRYQLWRCLASFARRVRPGGLRDERSLWTVMIDLLAPATAIGGSNLESVALTAICNVIKTAQDREEMRAVVTGAPEVFPRLIKQLFSLYTAASTPRPLQMHVRETLARSLPLFAVGSFDDNCRYLLKQKLAVLDPLQPAQIDLYCVELLIILGPHLSEDLIGESVEYLARYIDPNTANTLTDTGNSDKDRRKKSERGGERRCSNQLEKRVYRFLEAIVAADTDASLDYSKRHLVRLLELMEASGATVSADSRKCRLKCLYNAMKLLDGAADASAFLNRFVAEIIGCLNVRNKKARAVAGLMLVEGVLTTATSQDGEDQSGVSAAIDRVLLQVVREVRDKMSDNSTQSIQYKGALAKAICLVLSESRLARCVSRENITDCIDLVCEILSGHREHVTPITTGKRNKNKINNNKDSGTNEDRGGDRHLVYCALDIIGGLLRKKAAVHSNQLSPEDAGRCLCAVEHALLVKVRMPVKRVLKKMLKLWEYERIKLCIPTELVPVLRNIHKAMNRSKRKESDATQSEMKSIGGESCATSWAGRLSESGLSQKTMRIPHIKNIAEILQDSDSDGKDDDDLKSRATTALSVRSTKSAKSHQSAVTRASELRKIRKRKIDTANANLRLEENIDDIVDLSDVTHLARHLSIGGDTNTDRHNNQSQHSSSIIVKPADGNKKTIDKRGFRFDNGRLVIGEIDKYCDESGKPHKNGVSSTADRTEGGSDIDDDGDYPSKKGRFEPPKKRSRMEKLPGSQYKSHKKGAFGDKMDNKKAQPYAYIPMKNADQYHSLIKKYEKSTKKAQSEARKMSKMRKRKA